MSAEKPESYVRLRRRAVTGTLTAGALAAVILAPWRPWLAAAVAVGAVAGVANALLSMRGNERLLQRGSVPAFVLSSFGRLCLFGIVPVVLALRAPSFWVLGCYFASFFVPLAIYGVGLNREYRQEIKQCEKR